MSDLKSFEEYLLSEKHSSQNTVQSYLRDVGQFISYCEETAGINYLAAETKDIENYLSYLAAIGKSEATCSRMLASSRCFYKYLVQKGAVSSNPAGGIRAQKKKQQLPGILETNEVTLLLAQPSGNDYKSIRDKAMLEVLYATGMRVSELLELDVSDVNISIGIIHMKNSRHERIVPLYPEAVRAVTNYLHGVRGVLVADDDSGKLFTNMNGQPMSRQGFWKIVKHYSLTAGIKKDITPHTLRHSFAAHLLENGAQLKYIKEMLGHSDVSSTQIYAQFVKNKYTRDYSRFHPLAK